MVQCFFFPAWKKERLPWKFSHKCAWKIRPFRENITKTPRESNSSIRENFPCSTCVKIKKRVRENLEIIFTPAVLFSNTLLGSFPQYWLGRAKFLDFFCPWKYESHTWKFSRIVDFPCVKKKSHAWKNHWKCPWKVRPFRENFQKSVRESDFLSVKKSKKSPKKSFTHTFDFHAGKKKRWAAKMNAILALGQ